jgi:bacterioferritin (cytochrome b1)
MAELDKDRAVELLNRILEAELAGVVRYTHYSFLVFGHNRIPIVSWLREQAAESLTHAQQAGEMITLLGEYPSLAIGPLLDSHQTDIGAVMRESLETEAKGARPLSRTAEIRRRAVGHHRGIRPPDGLCRGASRERSRQDVAQTRRSRRLPADPAVQIERGAG